MNLGKENEIQEFKESLSQLDKGLKSITAMLNRNGFGKVYFGVDDDGNIIGTSIGKKSLEDIRNKIKTKIEPQMIYHLTKLTSEDGKEYIELKAEGSDIPYSFDGRYYIRTVSSDESVTNELLRKMLISSNSDLMKSIESENQELTFESFCKYYDLMGLYSVNKKEFFISKGFYNKEDKYNLLAYLLSDQSEISIKVVKFEGVDKTSMSSRTEFGKKCLLNSVDDVLNYFKSINTTNVNLSKGVREEISLFDFESFKEAWINACLHTAWSNMITPSIFIFDDRIEILSYGGLPYNLSLNSFYEGLSRPINLGLLSIFNNVKFSEQSGHGVPKIVNTYSKEAFVINDDTVIVKLKFAFEPDYVKFRNKKAHDFEQLTENQKNTYYYLKENPRATLANVANNLNLSLQGVKKIVSKLQDINLLERKGSKKDGYWNVK